MQKNQEVDKRKKNNINNIIFAICLIGIFYMSNNIIYRIRFKKSFEEILDIKKYFNPISISLDKITFLLSLSITFFVVFYVIYKKNKTKGKSEFKNIEHGSAKWSKLSAIKPFVNDQEDRNIIISKNLKMNANFLAKSPKYGRNKNVLVIGGSGTGKTRFFVKPNLMQLYGSYIVTDPKGSLIEDTGYMFLNEGYDIKIFNLKDTRFSMKYNPFFYINTELDILSFVNSLMENTKGEGEKSGEDFWLNAERMYFQALIGYMMETQSPNNQNIEQLLKYINMGKAEEDGAEQEIDKMFEELNEVTEGDSFAVRQYQKFKQGAGDTLRSILISVSARTSVFDIKEIRTLLSDDELNLHSLYKKDTVFFIIIDDTDYSLTFLASILYTQLMTILVNSADRLPNSRFEKPIQFILDEFANTGKIPNFEKLIATIRSRNISAVPILQSEAQLEAMYQKKAEILKDNCDSYLFLGSRASQTTKNLMEDLGKTSIEYEVKNISFDKSNKKSISFNTNKTGRDLMTSDEIKALDNDKCIFQLRGVRPFIDDKFKLEDHKRYNQIADYDSSKKFNVEEYLNKNEKEKEEFSFENLNSINLVVLDYSEE